MASSTASELCAIAQAKVHGIVDLIFDEAKKVAIRGDMSLDVSALDVYAKLTSAEMELMHVEFKTLGFTVEENRQNARYFMELKW